MDIRYSIPAICTAAIFMSVLFFSPSTTHSEEVGKFLYKGIPEAINGKIVVMHEKLVALNNYILVSNPTNIITNSGSASVFFIIDNSASNTQSVGTTVMSDFNGERFKVTRLMIDSLNRINPNIEVGLGVYADNLNFRLSDDVIFKGLTGFSNGYIPLLQLNKTYTSSNSQLNNKTGYEILCHYLKTKDNAINGGVDLAYGRYCGAGTNIDAGFNACKDAMLTAKNPKNSQFAIFFSDGIAAGGTWVTGANVPTTFTFFLLPMAVTDAPQELYTMTNNIKNNGYSATNPKTQMWPIKASQEGIMSVIVKVILPEIIKNITTLKPITITVNTITSPGLWDGKGFNFKNLFPLTGVQTPFSYEIKYRLSRDSITPNKDTIKLPQKDTVIKISYSVLIQPGAQVNDSFVVQLWGRSMAFYAQGVKVSQLNDKNSAVELRFTKYKVDTLYDYQNVQIVFSTHGGQSTDTEKFSMQDKGDYLAVTLPLATATAVPNDGTLQHGKTDSISAVFRNPDLPLDTLVIGIPFRSNTVISATKAVYYDRTADGHVDHLYVGFQGGQVADYLDVVVAAMKLPSPRMLEITGKTAQSGGIMVEVTEKSPVINTAVAESDKIVVPDSVKLAPDIVLTPFSLAIIDSMAPVIMQADLYDSLTSSLENGVIKTKNKVPPELRILFSEPIQAVKPPTPFRYLRPENIREFDATVLVTRQETHNLICRVISVSGVDAIKDNDSIWIRPDIGLNVIDEKENNQTNEKNIKRPIKAHVYVEAFYNLSLKISLLEAEKSYRLSDEIDRTPEVQKMVASAKKTGDHTYQGIMIFMIEPVPDTIIAPEISYAGTVKLFDALGNKMLSDRPMAPIPGKRLIYIWDGRTPTGRFCGAGAYRAIVSVTHRYKNEVVKPEVFKRTVGVKN
ncbi:MAG: hypothetical protein JW795_10620 [Chitinivibrionales bacterium]|nr:hypothetical protein [Chitinivibrionales bacterium]